MVFDVVASRQRRYKSRVLAMVEGWGKARSDMSLRALADSPPDAATHKLRSTEPATMQTVARNLVAFATKLGLNEDDACRKWADGARGFEHAYALDPVVGAVRGIGPALFAYMRMRCGADALKPDVRVAKRLKHLGFVVPSDPHAIMVVARAAAAEIGFDLLSLDQLLWPSE
ncbi:hypothetical protein [Actinokineospora sp. HUAS TT18]|uniref:hypothetical protein n=1 Tax=Actinokineospora sp. HUAS TT18 TaxID=3447451 RepID=UPI003F5285CC